MKRASARVLFGVLSALVAESAGSSLVACGSPDGAAGPAPAPGSAGPADGGASDDARSSTLPPDARPPVPAGCSDGGVGPTTQFDSPVGQWDESATWSSFNGKLALRWQNAGGDWTDMAGTAQGPMPFAESFLKDSAQTTTVTLDVAAAIIAAGKADFFIRRSGGINATFHSREAGTQAPVLLVNETIVIHPDADTSMVSSTTGSAGASMTLASADGFLARFTLPAGTTIQNAKLTLTVKEIFGDQTLQVFNAASAVRTIARPCWLAVDPTVVVSYKGSDLFKAGSHVSIQGEIATATLPKPSTTWMSSMRALPNAPDGQPYDQLCATFIEKLGADFRPGQGGKHPGFSNTGQGRPNSATPEVIDGVTYPNTAWGGRAPDGLHWSARSGYGGWTDGWVAARSYFYAMAPHDSFGWVDSMNFPYPRAKWFAYTQCVKMNTVVGAGRDGVGAPDGKLYYERSDIGPLYDRQDIVWRNYDYPQSRIRELWVDYYCGGTDCGGVENGGTVSFAKAIVTRGLPDMAAINAEIDTLRAQYP